MPPTCDHRRKPSDPSCIAMHGSHIDLYCNPCLERKLEGQVGVANDRLLESRVKLAIKLIDALAETAAGYPTIPRADLMAIRGILIGDIE